MIILKKYCICKHHCYNECRYYTTPNGENNIAMSEMEQTLVTNGLSVFIHNERYERVIHLNLIQLILAEFRHFLQRGTALFL